MFSLLFLCTGNACRSQMAQGWARHLLAIADDGQPCAVQVLSAGLEAHGLNPCATAVMQEAGVDISHQSSDQLDPKNLLGVDMVVTLCGHADEHCPVLPSGVRRQHWPLDDPARAQGRPEQVLAQFRKSRELIRLQVVQLLADLGQEIAEHRLMVPVFDGKNVQILERESCYRGFFELQRIKLRHTLYGGGDSEPFVRELFVRGSAVVVLLYDPQRDRVVLIEQFRVGALGDGRSPWLLELVAGIVEPGETVADVARRESLEEAGCEIQDLVPIHEYWVSPGGCNESISIFCGRVDSEGVGGFFGLKHEHEDIRVQVVAADVAISAVKKGEINNAASIMAFQWLQINRGWLRSHWSST